MNELEKARAAYHEALTQEDIQRMRVELEIDRKQRLISKSCHLQDVYLRLAHPEWPRWKA